MVLWGNGALGVIPTPSVTREAAGARDRHARHLLSIAARLRRVAGCGRGMNCRRRRKAAGCARARRPGGAAGPHRGGKMGRGRGQGRWRRTTAPTAARSKRRRSGAGKVGIIDAPVHPCATSGAARCSAGVGGVTMPVLCPDGHAMHRRHRLPASVPAARTTRPDDRRHRPRPATLGPPARGTEWPSPADPRGLRHARGGNRRS